MLKELFFLDPQIIYLNHGSFGACPKPVFDKYQAWQTQLEAEPVQFLGVKLDTLLHDAREVLGSYLNTSAHDIIFIPNATHGVNIIARSLKLGQADEILTTDHEYGACNFAWEYICCKTGAFYKQQPIKLPVANPEEILDQFWRGVTPKTKVIFFSHITSPTSLTMPIKEICLRARQEGILTVIDGAHAPGQISINLQEIQPDFYVGNCHKWMMSPKGAGFLYAATEIQGILEPLVVSWGYQSLKTPPKESVFVDLFQWTGTCDPAAYLTVPSSIQFMNTYHWGEVRKECHELVRRSIEFAQELMGFQPLYPVNSTFYQQMATIPIPRVKDLNELKTRLFQEFKIEIPCIEWKSHHYLRISVQGYNTAHDIEHLFNALMTLLPLLKE
jgi:isopenicillin-N epimerase